MATQAPIDIEEANERLGLGAAFYRDMLHMFLDDAPGRMQALRAAWSQGDERALHRAAHSLKGCAGNLGVTGMRHLAEQIEVLVREQRLQEAPPVLDAVEDELLRVAQYVALLCESEPVT